MRSTASRTTCVESWALAKASSMQSNAGRDAAIVSPLRTPVGKFGGALRDVPADVLAALAIRALMERTGLDPRPSG